MKRIFIALIFLWSQGSYPNATSPNFKDSGVLTKDTGGFYDKTQNYSNFIARIVDSDRGAHIVKIHSEFPYIRFFKPGDQLSFYIDGKLKKRRCFGSVRQTEIYNYVVIRVNDIAICLGRNRYLRKGTRIQVNSKILNIRTMLASKQRERILLEKDDYLKQLNDINNWLYASDAEKVEISKRYDREIVGLRKKKEFYLGRLGQKKSDYRVELERSEVLLKELDRKLNYYRIAKQDKKLNRWAMDLDSGIPVKNRPSKIKPKSYDRKTGTVSEFLFKRKYKHVNWRDQMELLLTYQAFYGAYSEVPANTQVTVSSTQNSPMTLGASVYLKLLDRKDAVYLGGYASYVTGLTQSGGSGSGQSIVIPPELNASAYYFPGWKIWGVELFGGFDAQRFSTFNTDEIIVQGANVDTREHFLAYSTFGGRLPFTIMKRKFVGEMSLSQSLYTFSSRKSLLSDEEFSGTRFFASVRVLSTPDYSWRLTYRAQNMVGPTTMVVSRLGFGVSWNIY